MFSNLAQQSLSGPISIHPPCYLADAASIVGSAQDVQEIDGAVDTANRPRENLAELKRYRRHLMAVHDCAIALPAFESIEVMLQRILDTAVAVCPTRLAVLRLETFEEHADPRRYSLQMAKEQDMLVAEAAAGQVAAAIARDLAAQADQTPHPFLDGFLVPLRLHRELGHGWIYLNGIDPSELAMKSLNLLAAHARNALYAAVAQKILTARAASPLFGSMSI